MKRPPKCSIGGPASSAYRLTADSSATPSTAEITYATGVGSVVIDPPWLCRLLSGGSTAMTNGQAPDGHHRRGKSPRWLLSVHGDAVRLILETVTGGLMQYALLAYAPPELVGRCVAGAAVALDGGSVRVRISVDAAN